MKKLTKSGFAGMATAALLAVGGLVPSANAQIVLTVNDYTIYIDGYTADNLYPGGPSTLPPQPSATDTGAKGGLVLGNGQREDTWGVFQITRITQTGNPVDLFNDGNNIEYWGMIYGSYDTAASFTGLGNLEAVSRGLSLDIYQHNIADPLNATFRSVADNGTAGRGGLSTYAGITSLNGIQNGGNPIFSATLNGDMTSTFYPSLHTSSATGFLAVNPSQTLFTVPAGFAFSPLKFIISGDQTLDISGPAVDWDLKLTGTVTGNVVPVPEPSTYGLISAGALLGLVAYRRMKVRAQAV